MTKRTKAGLIVPQGTELPVEPQAVTIETWAPRDIRSMAAAQQFYGARNLMTMPVCMRCQEVLLIAPRDEGGAVATCSCTMRIWPEPGEGE